MPASHIQVHREVLRGQALLEDHRDPPVDPRLEIIGWVRAGGNRREEQEEGGEKDCGDSSPEQTRTLAD
jgi:hypothetical protein